MSGPHNQPLTAEPYTNPAFASHTGMNYNTPSQTGMQYDPPSQHGLDSYNQGGEYTAQPVYGRTPLRHNNQGYGQTGYEQQSQNRSPTSTRTPTEASWDGASRQGLGTSPTSSYGYNRPLPRNEISPSRPRGIPADDNISYVSYGHSQQHQQQSRALLTEESGYDYQDQQHPPQPQMRQIPRQYASQDSLHPNRPPPASLHSRPPSTVGDRQHGIASNNSNRASSVNLGIYSDGPYQRYSTQWNPETSGLSSGNLSLQDMRRSSQDSEDEEMTRGKRTVPLTASLGGVFGKKEVGSTTSGLGAESGLLTGPQSRGVGGGGGGGDSEWLQSQKKASTKTKWLIAAVVLVILLLAAGGTAAGVILSKKKGGSGGGGGSATSSVDPKEDAPDAPMVNSGTESVKALLNNPNLHKSFYGMDYTPLNAIYPECLKWPATQNNITKDIAVISQMTSRLRLYGNDCNQTEMVIEAINLLNVDLKVWLGVYIDNNATTNTRQLEQMYNILDKYGQDPFLGVVLGNEALFRQEITESALIQLIGEVRTNFTSLGYKINITTSDLGSAWTYNLAQAVDTLMANVHPFFAGVTVDDAPGWTWQFTDNNDAAIARQTTRNPNVIVSEVGWPSGGGTYLGSVAGISELNQFVEQYVCEANKNGTEYYWFVPFDEPWKEKFNTPGKEWETRWGLMDVNRNLKPGVTIPDCPAS